MQKVSNCFKFLITCIVALSLWRLDMQRLVQATVEAPLGLFCLSSKLFKERVLHLEARQIRPSLTHASEPLTDEDR